MACLSATVVGVIIPDLPMIEAEIQPAVQVSELDLGCRAGEVLWVESAGDIR
jgi:hypothetical protein